jgi:isocitrate dehydrogenase (NAD+)
VKEPVVGLIDHARQLRQAIEAVLNQKKVRTRDLGGSASTSDYASAITQQVGSGSRR